MIYVTLEVDRRGRLLGVDARGHAGLGIPGTDPACAAVTTLLRTTGRLLAEDRRYGVTGDAGRPGRLSFAVRRGLLADGRRLRVMAEYLERGIGDISQEYPGSVALERKNGGE